MILNNGVKLQWLNDWFLQTWTREDTERPAYKNVQIAEGDQNPKKNLEKQNKTSESLGWDHPPSKESSFFFVFPKFLPSVGYFKDTGMNHIDLLLWHVEVLVDCGDSHKLCVAIFGRGHVSYNFECDGSVDMTMCISIAQAHTKVYVVGSSSSGPVAFSL